MHEALCWIHEPYKNFVYDNMKNVYVNKQELL